MTREENLGTVTVTYNQCPEKSQILSCEEPAGQDLGHYLVLKSKSHLYKHLTRP
jgi:hypothetical protein